MRFSMRCLAAVAVLGLSSVAMAEQIDNPEYAQWAKYKAGTFVTIQQSQAIGGEMPAGMPAGMDMSAMMPKISTTTTLAEVKADALTLETATETTMMGNVTKNKTTRTVPAKIEKPAATTTAPATQATLKDLKEGKDTLEVKGAKLETITREYTTTSSADLPSGAVAARGRGDAGLPSESHVKVWSSAEVPGGMVKMEMTAKQQQMDIKMSSMVVDYKVVK